MKKRRGNLCQMLYKQALLRFKEINRMKKTNLVKRLTIIGEKS